MFEKQEMSQKLEPATPIVQRNTIQPQQTNRSKLSK